MIVRILSKLEFDAKMKHIVINDDNVEDRNGMFISINQEGQDSYFKNDHSNVLRLYFHDITDIEYEWLSKEQDVVLFSPEQAKQIIEFAEHNKEKNICYVHCTAGVSRSGAIGTFVNDLHGEENHFELIKNNGAIKPNSFILATLRRVLRENY